MPSKQVESKRAINPMLTKKKEKQMKNRKLIVSLLGIVFAFGIAWQGFAQEEAPAADAQAMPPQVVTDGGVEAVWEAQEVAPAPVDEFKDAHTLLEELADKRGWKNEWDDKKKRIIVIEAADFKTVDPASDSSFFIKREMAAKKAVLSAKITIAQTINTEMSAIDQVNTPGTDLNEELGRESEKINIELARQKEILVDILENVDKAEADVLRGTTFGDRLNDLMVAAIKKLDKEYDANARDQKAQENYAAIKAAFEVEQKKYDELKEKAEAAKGKIVGTQRSDVEMMAQMPLYGTSVIMQTESWNKASGIYQVAVMLCWSYALERSARAIVTGEDFRVKPSASAKSIHDWLKTQDPATMIGPRQYLDQDGNRWFLGITARPYDDAMSSSARSKNKNLSEMFAQQMAAFCLWADVEGYKLAQQARESRGDDTAQDDEVAETFAGKLTQSLKNKTIRGMQRLFGRKMTHPITGSTIYVSIYGINSSAAKVALAIEKQNYATKVMDNHYQTVERGRDAANRDAVKASQNRQQDFQKGYNQQSNAVNSEVESRQQANQPAKGTAIINKNAPNAPAKPKQSTSGTFGGDVNVGDDF